MHIRQDNEAGAQVAPTGIDIQEKCEDLGIIVMRVLLSF